MCYHSDVTLERIETSRMGRVRDRHSTCSGRTRGVKYHTFLIDYDDCTRNNAHAHKHQSSLAGGQL